ncbi:hypothetical protein [Thalassobacillus sp. B23F22_16]|uniref:hypothetical protein n=1 Tax=Thalassobacillus sp. B23F22_16 TaxID=3459513 RepID=UPI00373F041E
MSEGIYLLQDNGELVEMNAQAYDSEELLQGLIAKYPNLLAGDQMDKESPRKWLLVSREMAIASEEEGSNRWSVDHLFIDQDGIPTLVEVKRSSDTRIRREVVGQLLEYAANATVYWPIEIIRNKFENRCDELGVRSESEIASHTDGKDQEEFWDLVETNLKMGEIRMVFLADEVPSELKRIVEFLNEQMSEVLAVEIKQFVGNNLKTLVPRVIGQTAEAAGKKNRSKPGKRWDYNSFFKEIDSNIDKDEVRVARQIYDWSEHMCDWIWWGQGRNEGSFVPMYEHNREYLLFAVRTKGYVELYFHTYQSRPPFDKEEKRLELLNRINSLLEDEIPAEAITKYPKVPMSLLKEPGRTEEFLEVYEWFLKEVREYYSGE